METVAPPATRIVVTLAMSVSTSVSNDSSDVTTELLVCTLNFDVLFESAVAVDSPVAG